MKLICIPYAGGSSTVFYPWRKYLDNRIELIPVELAGRGLRYEEDFYNDFIEAVDDVLECIEKDILESSYILFGHSLGSTMAFELTYRIIAKGYKPPKHIIFSAGLPPHKRNTRDEICNLSSEEFKNKIFDFGGTPKQVLEDQELAQIFLPIIKADLQLLDNYKYIDKPYKLPCNISVFYGEEDSSTEEEKIKAWSELTDYKTTFFKFKGNHFFINNNVGKITNIINIIYAQCKDNTEKL